MFSRHLILFTVVAFLRSYFHHEYLWWCWSTADTGHSSCSRSVVSEPRLHLENLHPLHFFLTVSQHLTPCSFHLCPWFSVLETSSVSTTQSWVSLLHIKTEKFPFHIWSGFQILHHPNCSLLDKFSLPKNLLNQSSRMCSDHDFKR